MKYCKNCGYKLSEDSNFCTNCGQRVETSPQDIQGVNQQSPLQYTYSNTTNSKEKAKANPFLLFATIFCFFGAAIMLLGFIISSETFCCLGGITYGTLGGLFLVLYKTPKGSRYILGKDHGLKKSVFIILCIMIIFVAAILFAGLLQCSHEYELSEKISATCTNDGEERYLCSLCGNEKVKNIKAKGHNVVNGKCSVCGISVIDNNISLSDIKKWYENNIPAVSQSLVEIAKSVNGLTSLNVDSSKFRFGESLGFYDCHYTFIFTCKVNGVNYSGEARAFIKYKDNTVHWFHFEIFSNNGITSLVEHYDDSYDKIIEDYYKELIRKYN